MTEEGIKDDSYFQVEVIFNWPYVYYVLFYLESILKSLKENIKVRPQQFQINLSIIYTSLL